jgi:hypothetical protein
MRTRILRRKAVAAIGVCCIALLGRANAQTPNNQPDAWDRVLGAVGLTKETTRFDFTDMANFGGQKFLLPFVDAAHREPLRIPFYTRVLKQELLNAAPSAGTLAQVTTWRMGEGTRRTLIRNPLEEIEKEAAKPDALLNAILKVHHATNSGLSSKRRAQLAEAVKSVPADIAQNAALLIYAEIAALQWRNRALKSWKASSRIELQSLFENLVGVGDKKNRNASDDIRHLMNTIDLKFLMAGGIDLAQAVDKAADALSKRTGSERFHFNFETPLGHIALHGAQDDVYSQHAYLLIIDSGGNDEYYGGGGAYSSEHPASVLLDLSGNDRYLENGDLAQTPVASYAGRKQSSAHPVFGAGVLGYGILADLQGDDLYRSLTNSQGRGLYGIGILQDKSGNDKYDCYTEGQGAATFGAGVLADIGGADKYLCFTRSQGFGGTKGSGVLVDTGSESDVYDANDTVIDFPSPQDRNHNATLGQGAGYGRRADHSDGQSLAGGVGALIDGGGDNTFSCGVYGQGTGYWYALGVLCTGTGNDTYRGVWYVQGAVAHFATGVLWDEGGNDTYIATHNVSQGGGHDFGTGFLIDDAGNDRHEAPNLSLGGGNNNGFGFFWDKGGDDIYIVGNNTSLGRASLPEQPFSIRDRNLTLGVFLDTGGRDTYPTAIPQARENTLWTMAENNPPPLKVTRGAALDTGEVGNLE